MIWQRHVYWGRGRVGTMALEFGGHYHLAPLHNLFYQGIFQNTCQVFYLLRLSQFGQQRNVQLGADASAQDERGNHLLPEPMAMGVGPSIQPEVCIGKNQDQ